ncbi:hypothetical protein, partial [Myceligenerans indicum]|uniref:hypothetical protein n=1 Tax=Myceligenerans indicum TaxID=2593663 RepID=UPI001A935B6C
MRSPTDGGIGRRACGGSVRWGAAAGGSGGVPGLSLIHISEPTRRSYIAYAVFCLKKKASLGSDNLKLSVL